MDNNYKKYEGYKDYQDYLNHQISGSKRRKYLTKKREPRRQWIYERMIELGIKGKTMLCIGARHDSELLFFEKLGYKVEGIDLYSTEKIIECDMSKMHKHPYIKNKKYDIVFSCESLEHCINVKGLLKGLQKVCKKYFIAMGPMIEQPFHWDCISYNFMGPENKHDINLYKKNILSSFPKFKIIVSEIHKRGKRFFFILKKKK